MDAICVVVITVAMFIMQVIFLGQVFHGAVDTMVFTGLVVLEIICLVVSFCAMRYIAKKIRDDETVLQKEACFIISCFTLTLYGFALYFVMYPVSHLWFLPVLSSEFFLWSVAGMCGVWECDYLNEDSVVSATHGENIEMIKFVAGLISVSLVAVLLTSLTAMFVHIPYSVIDYRSEYYSCEGFVDGATGSQKLYLSSDLTEYYEMDDCIVLGMSGGSGISQSLKGAYVFWDDREDMKPYLVRTYQVRREMLPDDAGKNVIVGNIVEVEVSTSLYVSKQDLRRLLRSGKLDRRKLLWRDAYSYAIIA